MIDFLLFNKILIIAINVISLILGFWIYLSDRRNKINQIFFLLVLSTSIWVNLYYFVTVVGTSSDAKILAKLGYGAVSLFFIPLYLFFIHFFHLEKRLSNLTKGISLSAILICMLSIFTDLIVKDVVFEDWGANIQVSNGAIIFYLMAILLSLFIIVLLIKKYFTSQPSDKIKIQYFLVGVLIWIMMNLVFNMILPLFQGGTPFAIFGNYSVVFFLSFTAYAIVKQELFGIRVILTQALVVITSLLLFMQAVTSNTWPEFSWKFILFIIFLYFGYLLIRSVIREIQRRAELQKLYNEVDKLSKTKSEFISIASHQLRTPLTAVKGYISMLIEGTYGKMTEKQIRPMENVYKSNERLIRLVNDLLNLSRLEAGRIELESRLSSLEELINGIVDEMKINAEKKGLTVEFVKLPVPLPKIMFDPDKLRQVILNLVDNAIKYTRKGGVIIELKRQDAKVQIEIKDTGEGMDNNELGSLFQMFSRATAGAQLHTEGAGIGLYVARQFIEMHGGKIWAESEGRGKGSVFYIELPIQ